MSATIIFMFLVYGWCILWWKNDISLEETGRGNKGFSKVYHIFIGMKFKDEGSLLRGNSTPWGEGIQYLHPLSVKFTPSKVQFDHNIWYFIAKTKEMERVNFTLYFLRFFAWNPKLNVFSMRIIAEDHSLDHYIFGILCRNWSLKKVSRDEG